MLDNLNCLLLDEHMDAAFARASQKGQRVDVQRRHAFHHVADIHQCMGWAGTDAIPCLGSLVSTAIRHHRHGGAFLVVRIRGPGAGLELPVVG